MERKRLEEEAEETAPWSAVRGEMKLNQEKTFICSGY